MNTREMAKRLSALGRNGDTLLAHITPKEAKLLKQAGGAGTRNPKTGLREYFDADFGGDLSGADAASNMSDSGGIGGDFGSDGGWGYGPGNVDDGGWGMGPGNINDLGGSTGDLGDLSDQGWGYGPGNINDPGTAFGPSNDLSAQGWGYGPGNIGDYGWGYGPGNIGDTGMSVADIGGPTAIDNIVSFLSRLGKGALTAKGIGLLARATGIPGVVLGTIASGVRGAVAAPTGKGAEGFGRGALSALGNSAMNQATGGAWGLSGMSVGSMMGKSGAEQSDAASSSSGGEKATPYDPMVDYMRGGLGLLGAYNLYKAGQPSSSQRTASGQMDALLRTGDVTKLPGFAAGKQAVERAAAGKGYLGSGNLNVALAQYGDQFYNNALQTFNTISNQNAALQQQSRNDALILASQALGSLGYGYYRSNPSKP